MSLVGLLLGGTGNGTHSSVQSVAKIPIDKKEAAQ